jgi:hypothetical protein
MMGAHRYDGTTTIRSPMSDNPTIYCQSVYINCVVVSEDAETHDLEDLQEPGDGDEEEEVENTHVYLGTSGTVAIEFKQRGKRENITVTLPRSAAQQLMYGLSSVLM